MKRRMRVRYLACHNPPVWASFYEPPGRAACYCHTTTLGGMWEKLHDYFAGRGDCPAQQVSARFLTEAVRVRDEIMGRT